MLCVQVMFFFVSILHFYAYVTMFYRLVGAVMNLLQANLALKDLDTSQHKKAIQT